MAREEREKWSPLDISGERSWEQVNAKQVL